jgi:excisionase family DNA binding protein
MEDRLLITVSEAARRLDTYPNAINRWIAKGELEAFRVEGRVFRFVDAEQVEALRLAWREPRSCDYSRKRAAFTMPEGLSKSSSLE